MDFQKFFLKRYFHQAGRKEFFSFNSLISILGIIIGVVALTVSLGLFSGYQDVLQDIIIGVNSHIYIMKYQNEMISEQEYAKISSILDSTKSISSFAPYIYTECMSSNDEKLAGIILRGIDYGQECKASNFDDYIAEGSFKKEGKNIVLGEKIAKRLNASVGDTILLITPLNSKITLAGMMTNKMKVNVSGIFCSGMFEFDNSLAFINIRTMQNFLNLGRNITGISVKLHDDEVDNSSFYADKLNNRLAFPFYTTDWKSMNINLFNLLELEKWVIFIILALIVVVAGFGLTSVLVMNIFDKEKEIGILKALVLRTG